MRRRLLVFARTLPEDWYYAKMGAEMAAVMPQHDESYKPIPKMAYEFWLADAIVGIAIQFWWTMIVNCKHPTCSMSHTAIPNPAAWLGHAQGAGSASTPGCTKRERR